MRAYRPTTEVLEDRCLLAATLLADLNQATGAAFPLPPVPSNPVTFQGALYFAADDGVHGLELWRSDGTAAGTRLVKDIQTGDGNFVGPPGLFTPFSGSSPSDLTVVNNTLFFTATDDTHGPELWKSDGTEAGTVLVKDIATFATPSPGPSDLLAVGNTLFFRADDGVHGTELWKSDGTEAGTVLVKDINSGYRSSAPMVPHDPGNRLAAVNGIVYFAADDGYSGLELWKSDGTEAGTVLVRDINPSMSSSNPRFLTSLNNAVYFVADDGVHGVELSRSDGTAAGTRLVKDIDPTPASPATFGLPGSSSPSGLTVFNGKLFFAATDPTHFTELWRTDGTEAGTVLVKDISTPNSDPFLGSSNPTNLIAVGNTLFFLASDGQHGTGLWKTDGSAAGTTLVKGDVLGNSPFPISNMAIVNGTLFFSAFDADHGFELWKTDDTPAHTSLVRDLLPGPDGSTPFNLTAFNGMVYFVADDGVHGTDLWRSDGTAAGTRLVADINALTEDGFFGQMVDVNGTLFFGGADVEHGLELWKTDGTTAGTVLVQDINPSDSSLPIFLTSFHGQVFFVANDGTHGFELWKSDGTAAGTVLVKDIGPNTMPSDPNPLSNGSSAANLTVVGDTLYFTADDGVHGNALLKTDGTAAGTMMVKDVAPNDNSPVLAGVFGGAGAISWLTNVNGTLFFAADDGVHGNELWKSDGTEAGTALVKDIYPGLGLPMPSYPYVPGVPPQPATGNNSMPLSLVNISGTLFFTADDGVHGREWWRSDGSSGGTFMLKDVNPGLGSGALFQYAPSTPGGVSLGGMFFFAADPGNGAAELWRSDGSSAGTVLVTHFGPAGASLPAVLGLTVANNTLFFTTDDGVHGAELWKSNGTEAGTMMVKDIYPGQLSAPFPGSPTPAYSSFPSGLTGLNGILYFHAEDGVHGREWWRTDGTEAGTVMLGDIKPGPDGGAAATGWASPALSNGKVFLPASDGVHGVELWTDAAPPAPPAAPLPTFLTANQVFVGRLYHDLLHRDVDTSGLAHWVGQLDHGTSRADVARAIEQSLEYRTNLVQSLYAVLLHRAADAPGLSAFTAFLGAGGTFELVIVGIASSPEYFQRQGSTNATFLGQLYRDILGREVDPSGSTAFGGALALGMSRVNIVGAIVSSAEYRQQAVRGFYQTYLSRPADDIGLNVFVAAPARQMQREEVIVGIVSSDEYLSRMRRAAPYPL